MFRSTLRLEELRRVDLRLSELKFVEDSEATGVLGEVTVKLNLWVGAEEFKFDVQSMQAPDHYLIVTEQDLPAGVYAFHAESILHPKGGNQRLPEELKVIYPFEIGR